MSNTPATPALESVPPADRDALLSAHLKPLSAYFYRRLRYHDAEDLTNDTITLVLAKWDRYDPARPFWPWLVTIASRVLATAVLRGRLDYNIPLAEDTGGVDHSPADPAPAPLDGLIRHENIGQVRAAIDALPPHQREAVLLYYFEALKIAEIAEIEGVPPGTIYRRLWEARKRLGMALGESHSPAR